MVPSYAVRTKTVKVVGVVDRTYIQSTHSSAQLASLCLFLHRDGDHPPRRDAILLSDILLGEPIAIGICILTQTVVPRILVHAYAVHERAERVLTRYCCDVVLKVAIEAVPVESITWRRETVGRDGSKLEQQRCKLE